MCTVGVDKLMDQAGFPNARFTHHCGDLSMPLSGLLQRSTKLLHFRVAAHKPSEAAGGRRLQARAGASGRYDLEDLNWALKALDRPESQCADHDVALSQLERRRRDQDRARHGQLLQARGQVGRLANGRVVHVEVAADGADDHLARISPDPDMQGHSRSSVHLLGVLLY